MAGETPRAFGEGVLVPDGLGICWCETERFMMCADRNDEADGGGNDASWSITRDMAESESGADVDEAGKDESVGLEPKEPSRSWQQKCKPS